jgi:hypothetical protein
LFFMIYKTIRRMDHNRTRHNVRIET